MTEWTHFGSEPCARSKRQAAVAALASGTAQSVLLFNATFEQATGYRAAAKALGVRLHLYITDRRVAYAWRGEAPKLRDYVVVLRDEP